MKKWKWISFILIIFGLWQGSLTVWAGTIYESPYVSFSPDGQAWTTDVGNKNTKWYMEGSDDVITGTGGSLREIRPGEHYYAIKRTGSVPIARWQVYLSKVNCCHNDYPEGNYYHGVYFTKVSCYRPHFSGWRPICADCGEVIVKCNFYMSRQSAQSIDYLELGDRVFYYYLCPHNQNLEQGTDLSWHKCRNISANRYRVVYDANAEGEVYGGYMAPSFHMYDNASLYEDREVTPQTRLNRNAYTRIGWTFMGWNTKADGSGIYYGDEEEILNLCDGDYNTDEEGGTVVLYALWQPARGILEIDPNGGSYAGSCDITVITGQYGESYEIDPDLLNAPLGYRVTFDTKGGEKINELWGTQRFTAWKRVIPFMGKLQENCYLFCVQDGNTDRVLASYVPVPIILPEPRRENYSFGGWYYDEHYTKFAGVAGTEFMPEQDMTLYAQWVELVLTSEDNYVVNGGGGAVDLSWTQPDGQDKTYKLFQSLDGEHWEQIYTADAIGPDDIFEEVYSPAQLDYTVKIPSAGIYSVEACGAQGSGYKLHQGGRGGKVKGFFWFKEGETLTIGVGGRNGLHGGGKGKYYGNGGGYSSVESSRLGLLMIAGGGGGAGLFEDGGAGGLEEGLLKEGHNGDSGEVGGGGGYYGGLAGASEAHYHVPGVCNHVHTGNAILGTGCYTLPVKCGETLQHAVTGKETWHWGGSDEEYCPNCGTNNCKGHERDIYSHTCPIHGKRSQNYEERSPSTCSVTVRYDVGCGKTEEYICGYAENGTCLSSIPAYGGSNYQNTDAGTFVEYDAGKQAGNGVVRLKSIDIGYYETNQLLGVRSGDKAAPDGVSVDGVKMIPGDEDMVLVQWQQPEDNGTLYYHRAESYLLGNNTKLSTSNITVNTLVSGIKGYWYCVDENKDTQADTENGLFVSKEEISIILGEEEKYLHLVVEDVAGNRSETVHILVGGSGQWHGLTWPIYTEQLSIQAGESVYPAEADKTFYVRCDGMTPFVLNYGEYIKESAREDFQPNYAIIETKEESGKMNHSIIHVPSCAVSDNEWELPTARLRFVTEQKGYLIFGGYSMATRGLQCRRLTLTQEFLVDKEAHGRKLSLIPIGGADYEDQIFYSDYQRDSENGIWIIGDCEAPEILGLDALEKLSVLDRRQGAITLQLTAIDELSGVREWNVKIENLDNGCVLSLSPDENGVISVDITEDVPAFSGDFTVLVCAVDNVGNECTLSFSTTEFDLHAEITCVLDPHEPVFKRGESALLKITSWGYADRIEVEFPEEFLGQSGVGNQVYVYEDSPMYKQEEEYGFMIPLYVPEEAAYKVTVRAYKGDKMLERYPELAVFGVQGTVLDELRTRLR